MDAGRLDQRVTIQTKSVTRGAHGGEIVTWTDVATEWMEVLPISGREFVALRAAGSDLTVRFRMRYRAGITAAMRFVWGGSAYDVEPPIAPPRTGFMEVMGRAQEVPS